MHIIPTVSPRFILGQNMKLSGTVELGLQRAVGLARGTWAPRWVDEDKVVLLQPKADDVVTVLKSMHGKKVAFDVETDGRHPLLCDLRCIAFYDGKRAITVPLLRRTGERDPITGKAVWEPYYRDAAKTKVLKAIKELLQNATLLTQNGQYDRMVVKASLGFEVPSGWPHFDTILGHHIVAPYFPHSLGFLAALYTDSPYYKATASGDAWSSESDHELWLYNARDVIVTWLVAEKMVKEVQHDAPQFPALYEQDSWQEAQCERWKETGILLDPYALAFFRQHYQTIMGRALDAMKDVVKGLAKSSSDEALQELLEKLASKAKKQAEKALDYDALDSIEAFDDEGTGRTVELFNPASLNQLRVLLHAVGIPLTQKTATGQLSTAKEFLTGVRKELLEKKVSPDDLRIAFLDYLFAWRESSKVDSTYLYPELIPMTGPGAGVWPSREPFSRVHPTFNVHVVPTGRLSSSNPNFQNQPPEIRGMYIADEDHVLVAGDWDALELRLGAYNSQDPEYIRVFREYDAGGVKPHIANMSVIFGLPATKEAADTNPGMYTAAKTFAYAVAYGAGDQKVFENVREALPDIEYRAFIAALNNYRKKYARLFQFQREVVAQGTQKGYLESGVLKRRVYFFERVFGDSSPEATAMQNFPYQCLTGQQRVLTSVGYKRIGTLPEYVIAWTGQRWTHARVIKKGTVPTFDVKLRNGIILTVDATHHFLHDAGPEHVWKRTDELQKGTRIALDLAREHGVYDEAEDEDIPTAYLAGFYVGNGSTTRDEVQLVIGSSEARHASRRPEQLVPRLMTALEGMGVRAQQYENHLTLNLYRREQVEAFIRRTGIDPTQEAHTKRVPEWVWSGTLNERRAFLRGLLDADGCLGPDKEVRLQLCQRELLQECWLLARTCGVTGSIYGPVRADVAGHEAWVLILNAAQAFDTLVQWAEKRPRLKPTQLAPTWVAKVALVGMKFQRSTSQQVIASRVRGGGSTSPYTILAMGRSHDELYDYTEVESITPTGKEEPVYTLSVDDPQHRYVAEGTIAKNSTGADVVGLANRRIMDECVIPWRKKRLKKGERLEQLAQVHDELLFLVPKRLAEEFKAEFKRLGEVEVKPGWKLPIDIKVKKRWKPVQTRCRECREATDVEMTQPHRWEGKCSKGHAVRVNVKEAA